jgi:hypothetical protein
MSIIRYPVEGELGLSPVLSGCLDRKCVWLLHDLGDPDLLREQMLHYETSDLSYRFRGTLKPPAMSEMVLTQAATRLVLATAYPGMQQNWVAIGDEDDLKEAIDTLIFNGYVEQEVRPEGNFYGITRRGADADVLMRMWTPGNASSALAIRDVPIAERTVYEHMLALQDAGWEWQPLPPLKKRRGYNLRYAIGDDKIFYSSATSNNVMCNSYLRALQAAEDCLG